MNLMGGLIGGLLGVAIAAGRLGDKTDRGVYDHSR